MSKTYCGHDWDSMNGILDTLCDIEDSVGMTDKEQEAMNIAIQCVTDILNLLQGHPVTLDGDGDE